MLATLNGLFSSQSEERPSKKGGSKGSKKEADAAGNAGPDETTAVKRGAPAASSDTDWLQNALRVTFKAFGEEVDQRFNLVESRVEALEGTTGEVAKKLTAHRGALEEAGARLKKAEEAIEALKKNPAPPDAQTSEASQVLEKRVQDIEARMKRDQQMPGAGSSSDPPPSRPTAQDRTLARVGNLGWDSDGPELAKRFKELLAKTGIPEDSCVWAAPIVGRSGKGSAMQVQFADATTVDRLRAACRAARVTYGGDRFVWCDVQRTPEELRPAKLVHRVAEVLADFEKGKQDGGLQVEKHMYTKTVTLGGDRVAYILAGKLRFCGPLPDRYSQEDIDLMRGFAEG